MFNSSSGRTKALLSPSSAQDRGPESLRHASRRLEEEAQAFHNPLSLPIKIGGIPSSLRHGALRCNAKRSLSILQLYLREDTTAGLVAELLANQLDLALIALPTMQAL